jgi:hypothetical protein
MGIKVSDILARQKEQIEGFDEPLTEDVKLRAATKGFNPEISIEELEEKVVKVSEVLSSPIPAYVSTTGAVEPRHPLSQRFHALLKEMGEMHDKKGADYGSPADPFLNIRQGHEFGIEPWKNAMSRAGDKMVRIKQFAKTGSLENESVKDSLLDLASYAIIALILLEEDEVL